MKKNILFILIISINLSFCAIKPIQEQWHNNIKTLVSNITLAITAGLISGELWAQLDNNECDEMPSTRYVAGNLAIDLPLASILNTYNIIPRKSWLINSAYFLSSKLSYYASPYIHDAFQSALG